jgi:hypothetical protein
MRRLLFLTLLLLGVRIGPGDSVSTVIGPNTSSIRSQSGAQPILNFLPDELSFAANEGEVAAPVQFTLSNTGSSILSYTIVQVPGTVATNPLAGTLTSETDSITAQFPTSSTLLAVDSPHRGTLQINSNASNAIAMMPWRVDIGGLARLDLPEDMDTAREGPEGGGTAPINFSITNGGGAACTLSISDAVSWMGVFCNAGVLDPAEVAGCSILFQNPLPAAGVYGPSPITAICPGATNSPLDVNITLTVTSVATPTVVLQVSPTSLSSTTIAGGTAPAVQLSIDNTGGSTSSLASVMNWSVSDNQSYVGPCTPSSGTVTIPAGQVVSDGADAVSCPFTSSGLTAGSYPFEVTVTATGATGSPDATPGVLTVNPAGGTLYVRGSGYADGSSEFCDCIADLDGAGNNISAGGSTFSNATCQSKNSPIIAGTVFCEDAEHDTFISQNSAMALDTQGFGAPAACVEGTNCPGWRAQAYGAGVGGSCQRTSDLTDIPGCTDWRNCWIGMDDEDQHVYIHTATRREVDVASVSPWDGDGSIGWRHHRDANSTECGQMGSYTSADWDGGLRSQFTVSWMMYYGPNGTTPRTAQKTTEYGDNGVCFGGCSTYASGSHPSYPTFSCDANPNPVPRNMPFAASVLGFRQNVVPTINTGRGCISSAPRLVLGPAPGAWDGTGSKGTWQLHQLAIAGVGTQSGRIRRWVNGVLLYEANNVDFASDDPSVPTNDTDGFGGMNFNNYFNRTHSFCTSQAVSESCSTQWKTCIANGSCQYSAWIDSVNATVRLEDNYIITTEAEPPSPCVLGYNAAGC